MVLLVSLSFVLCLFFNVGNCMHGTCNYFYMFTCFLLDTSLIFNYLNLITIFVENEEYFIISSEWGVLESTQV